MARSSAIPFTHVPTEADIERFWAKTREITRGQHKGCIMWTAAKVVYGPDQAYGRFRFEGRTVPSHRFALYLELGHDPGPSVDHVCYNTLCVNPKHLRGGAIADNNATRRVVIADYCQKGHPRTPENVGVNKSNGRRFCYPCAREADRRRYPAKYEKEKQRNTHYSEMRDFHRDRKLTREQVEEIRARYDAGGVSQRQLAREFEVSQPMIGFIVRRESWK